MWVLAIILGYSSRRYSLAARKRKSGQSARMSGAFTTSTELGNSRFAFAVTIQFFRYVSYKMT